jgi:hypothetical protein
VDPGRPVEVVLEVDDHRIPDLQAELRARELAVEGLEVRHHTVADVDGRLVGDDRRLDDVRVRVRVDDRRDDVGIPARDRQRARRQPDPDEREHANARHRHGDQAAVSQPKTERHLNLALEGRESGS